VTFHLIAIILQEPKQWVSSNFVVYIDVNNLVTLTIVFFLSSLVKYVALKKGKDLLYTHKTQLKNRTPQTKQQQL